MLLGVEFRKNLFHVACNPLDGSMRDLQYHSKMRGIKYRTVLEQINGIPLRFQKVLLERKHVAVCRLKRSKRVYRARGHEYE